MAKIKVTNPKQIINGGAKKYYFKVKGVGGIKGDKGDKGDTGSQGPQGPQGNAATIEVGSTTTLPTGYDATVTNTGTINNAILNFGIPRGIKGDTGAKGDKGDKGDKGEQGNTGPQGPAGQNATVYIGTTTTGAPGTQASVYNSGTDRNATLNFTIPRGATGATGATGPQGPAGQDGQNFTPTVVDSLPATGDQSKLYLTPKAHTTQTASGNPVTATITDDAGKLESFRLDGDTFQQGYTGKNLLRLNDGTMTLGGVAITTTNGTVNLNGTATSGGQGYYVAIGVTASEPMVFSVNISGATSGLAIKLQYKRGGTVYYPSVYGSITLQAGDEIQTMYLIISNGSVLDGSFSPMLELGSTATSYEPYVGGVPSPNPDYPQAIQTVTGEQTVEVVGKNLFDKDNMDIRNGYLYSTTFSYRTTNADRTFIVPCEPNTTYTISRSVITSSFRAAYIDLEPSEIPADASSETSLTCAGYIANNSGTSITITTSATAKSLLVHYGNTNTDGVTLIDQSVATIMVEKSASATTYAPYHATSYPIDLGTIELCKIGTYQDYIYKDGDSWKVHKETKSVTLDEDDDWSKREFGTNAYHVLRPDISTAQSKICIASQYFRGVSYNDRQNNQSNIIFADSTAGMAVNTRGITIRNTPWADLSSFLSWISGKTVECLYVLLESTDTTITDTNLIAQLEAIRTASLENGANTITNTATGSNLAGDMEIGYYGYNPTNRYDKWLWLDINNNYEKLGS